MNDSERKIGAFLKIIWPFRRNIIRNTVLASVIIIIIVLLFPNWYKATVVLLPPKEDANALNAMRLLGNVGMGDIFGGSADHDKLLSILKSNTLLKSVALKYNFQEIYYCDNMEETIKSLKENMSISLGKEMQIFITFWDKDQEKVAEIANYFAICLDSINIELSIAKASNNRLFIEKRIFEVIDSLRILENDIINFMEVEGILSLDDQISVSVKNAAELRAQINIKEIELAIAKNTYDNDNPIVRNLESELFYFKKKFKEYFEGKSEDKLLPSFNDVPKLSVRFKQLERKAEYYLKLLEFLAPQYESSKIEEKKNIPMIQILDKADRPEEKDKPRRSRYVIFVFLLTLVSSTYYYYYKWKKINIS